MARLRALRERSWSPAERSVVIAAIAIALGAVFVTTYSLALGDPVPHRINAAVIGNPATHTHTVDEVQGIARHAIVFRPYPTVPAALQAIDEQRVYAALDLSSKRPTLYVAGAAGVSVARVLEKVVSVDPAVRVVDKHPLEAADPNGIDIFYLMLVATIIGFITIFQVQAHAGGLAWRHWIGFVVGFALAASLALTLVDGDLAGRLHLPLAETWGILALHLLAVASFASLMSVLIGRWAIVPTWLFFVVLGNSASGGAVAPALLPRPFAFLSQWLPSGATVTAMRDAVYFRNYQHLRPVAVLATWAAALFAAMVVAHRRAARAEREARA
jgi:hypothetical protein